MMVISSKDYFKIMLQRYELHDDDIDFVKKIECLDLLEAIAKTNTKKNPIKFNRFEKLFDKRLVEILKSLMIFSPNKRPDVSEVLKNSLFDDMRVQQESKTFKSVKLMTDFENYDCDIDGWRKNCISNDKTLI